MTYGWQEISVMVLIAGAVFYLVRRYLRCRRLKQVCDQCPVRKSQVERLLG